MGLKPIIPILFSVALFSYGCEVFDVNKGISPSETGTFLDLRDSREYAWARIGDQVWMTENLAYLPEVSPSNINYYLGGILPYYFVYGYEDTLVNESEATENYITYGALYNWIAACEACPEGWHLPDNEEWNKLIEYVGGHSYTSIYPKVGKVLKEAGNTHWIDNSDATNESEFTALPGGYRNASSFGFHKMGLTANFWTSSTFVGASAYYWRMFNDNDTVWNHYIDKGFGFSIRCVRDE